MLVEALHGQYALPELLSLVGLARSSYFYHRARLKLADKYLAVRGSINRDLRQQLPLQWISQGAGIPAQGVHRHLREGGSPADEAGGVDCGQAQTPQI